MLTHKRGGVSYISKRYSQAKNKYLKLTQTRNQKILYTSMEIIYMGMLCLNFFQLMDLNGLIVKILTEINTAK